MAIEQIGLEHIEDNPYQSRLTYHRGDIDNLAASIKLHGLLQVPPARRKDGRIELGFGHLRKRAFLKLSREDAERWGKMPLDIRDLSDEQMAVFALEENIKRRDITPIEVARAVGKYLESFADKTETELAKLLNMTQGNISNMRRVLRLPAKVLEKIDEGKISFTMGRELLIFQGRSAGKTREWSQAEQQSVDKPIDEEYMMLEAIRGITTNSHPCTVDGMQKSIHHVASHYFKTLDKTHDGPSWYYHDSILFDAKKTGCFACDKMIRTHPTKSGTAHSCTDRPCWEEHQEAHKTKAAAEAKKKMEEDILKTVVQAEEKRAGSISQEIPPGTTKAADETAHRLKSITEEAKTGIKPDADYWGYQFGTSYELVQGTLEEHIESVCGQCIHRQGCDTKLMRVATPGGEYLQCETLNTMRRRITPGHKLCLACRNRYRCDGTNVHADDNSKLVCDKRIVGREQAKKAQAQATTEVPEELRTLAMEKAGTRAEVLDIRELRLGHYGELNQGYELLDGHFNKVIDMIKNPDECLERCTTGFHYAFDSEPPHYQEDRKQLVYHVCSNTKCLAKKKAAFTRAKNAAGQARKNAEMSAIRQAVAQTTTLDCPRMKLVIVAQMEEGSGYYSYYRDSVATWFANKLKLETKSIERDKLRPAILKAIDVLSDEDMAKLIVEYMLVKLTDKDHDIQNYRVKTTEPLNLMGIGINVDSKGGNHGD